MFKSKIAVKLAAYFALAIFVFAFVIAFSFGHFYRQNVIERQQRELAHRASRVAAIMGDNLERSRNRGSSDDPEKTGAAASPGSLLRSRRLIAYVNTITADDVWVAGKDGTIEMRNHMPPGKKPAEAVQGQVEEHRGPQGRDLPPVFVGTARIDDLPQAYRELFRRGLKGESGVREDFDNQIKEMMVSAATPIYTAAGGVEGVLMLRTPVFGLRQSFGEALEVFAWCLGAALLLALAVAWFLSLKFTRPLNKMKNTAEQLAAGDYTARSYVRQNDEIGELADAIDNMAGRLELADRETQKTESIRKAFIANISHELRTPVTVLRGSLEALRDKVVTAPAEVERYHETMHQETLFLQRLINDLLDLSRLQSADFSIEKEPLNLCSVVEGAVRSARHIARGKGIRIHCDMDTPVYKMTGDHGRLNQMLLIFLDNAVKFSPENSTIEVRLAGRQLAVTDHGPGIRKEDLPHAFDRFYKTRSEQNKTGSGLGLAIAREIAERHAIVPGLRSEYGKGTVVILELPPPEALTAEERDGAGEG